MTAQLLVIFCIIRGTYSCMDSNCIDCISYSQNHTVFERCNQCRPNYLVDSDAHCSVNVTKFISLIFTGLILFIGSLVLRSLLILYNTRKKKIYTAEYQQEVFQYMTKKQQVPLAIDRPFVVFTERRLMSKENDAKQQQQIKVCDICKNSKEFRNKWVDTFAKCHHNFHAMCIRTHMTREFHKNEDAIYTGCPNCRRRIQYLTIYCQHCRLKHRNIEIKEQFQLYRIYSFVCFRCKAIQKAKKKDEEKESCYGMGKYLCCHCVRD